MRSVLVAMLAIVALAAAPAIAAARLPKVLTQLKPAFQVRPAVISYTGDGTGIVGGADGTSAKHPGHLRWTTYDSRQGLATGRVWLDDCEPDCADGTFHSTPVSVHVFSPRNGRFRFLTLKYTYEGRHYTDRRAARYYPGIDGYPGSWSYAIVGR